MIVSRDIEIVKKKTGEVVLSFYGTKIASVWGGTPDEESVAQSLTDIYRVMMRLEEGARYNKFCELLDYPDNYALKEKLNAIKEVTVDNESEEEKLTRGLNGLLSFFTEFNFTPNFRFVNTLANKMHVSNKVTENDKSAKAYILNYFKLSGSPYVNEIAAKIKSDEFKEIISNLAVKTPEQVVNNRLRIFYGEQGTGKTTQAFKETNNKCVVCNSSLLPDDLLSNFNFEDGKAAFEKSPLRHAMENGEKILLDEINLLPFDSLRFLQGLTDGKPCITYKGEQIDIKPGFEIIGTMNLTVNGMQFALPAPLVDRCSDIKEFELTAADLLGAF